jgi:hypothetical protein
MFEVTGGATHGAALPVVPTLEHLAHLVSTLARLDGDVSDGERISQLDALERVKAACAAAQARVTAKFVDSQAEVAEAWRARAAECSRAGDFDGWRAAREQARRAEFEPLTGSRRGRARATARPAGVASQVALARRESPARAARVVGASLALVRHLPHTLAALTAGVLTERRAELVVRGTSHLAPELQAAVDREVVGAAGEAAGTWGDRELERRVRACADRIDAEAAVERARRAESERRVTIRPVPDTLAVVSAVLPVAQAVALHASLIAAAVAAKAAGDARTKGQVMADTLVERVTGQADAPLVPIEVQVVITDRALFAGDATPAHVPGYGTVPAGWARDLLTRGLAPADGNVPPGGLDLTGSGLVGDDGGPQSARVWLRRLFTHPGTGTLVAMESRRRVFDAGLRRFLVARDLTCRTPWCDAPIGHADHVRPHAAGGPTTDVNGQGLCVRCNLVKEQPGWAAEVVDLGRTAGSEHSHTVAITTPTGHRYASTAPPLLPGQLVPPEADSPLEAWLDLCLAA